MEYYGLDQTASSNMAWTKMAKDENWPRPNGRRSRGSRPETDMGLYCLGGSCAREASGSWCLVGPRAKGPAPGPGLRARAPGPGPRAVGPGQGPESAPKSAPLGS